MKRINWQRLATIGLCSSLVINAFSGVTAIAETVTSESSPTVANSIKEATPASSARQESTESSQKTTETSQEEVTQETAKQAETKAPLETPEIKTNTTEQPAENSSENDRQKSISPRWVPNNQVIYPRITLAFTNESGQAFADENLTLSGTYTKFGYEDATSLWRPYAVNYPITSSNAEGGQYRVAVNATVPLPYDFFTDLPANYRMNIYAVEQLKIDNTLKYVDSIVAVPNSTLRMTRYSAQQTTELPQFGNHMTPFVLRTRDSIFSKSSENVFSLNTDGNEFLRILSVAPIGTPVEPVLYGFDGTATYRETLNYVVTRKQVTEKFVDANGVAITPPTGFTQNKKTPMTSNAFTFKQAGTLPETYKASNGKTYQFKGWYKGKTKPNTLTTTKAPSYAVTYDDNDDLNVVYEEIKVFDFPALTYQFGFVDESGKRVDASTIKLTYDNWHGEGLATNSADSNKPDYWKTVSLEKGQVAPTKNNLKEIAYPAQSLEILSDRSTQHSAANLTFTLPNYYEKISVYNKSGTFDIAYPFPNIQGNNYSEPFVEGENKLLSRNFELKNNGSQSFIFNRTTTAAPIDIQVPSYLRKVVHNPNLGSGVATYLTIDKPVYYYLTNRKVTENFVDTNGTKITPPTGFTQGNQIPMTSNTFKYTSAKVLPASYTTGGKTYIFQGWYKGKTKPNTLTTSTTPTYNTTFDGNDDMTAVYKEANISANLTMRGAVDVIDNGAAMEYWEVLLKNTGEAPLTSVKIKPTTDWAAGISTPTELFILGTGQNTKVRPITKEQWEAGFEIPLDSSLPVGGQLTINLLGTKVTGQPNQVLKAAVEVTGNFNKLTASDTVRIKDLDQETKEPTGEGFISVPTFNFGQVGVAGSTQQHSLKKAADYYGNGTRNPYLRIKKTQPNWSLTAQLSQPKSATDSLPTATRLLLGTAAAASFTDYNQPTETKTPLGKTGTVNLTADNTATAVVANQQFTGSDVYQLDFTFANIKLEVPANQGMVGQQYQAAVTWNLVTGP